MNTFAELVSVLDLLVPLEVRGEMHTQEVTAITCDSRKVTSGCLFVAVCGSGTDGRRYVTDAISKGCLAVVVEGDEVVGAGEVPVLHVRDSHLALGDLAAAWFEYPARQLQLIGVTGTNGKTTTSWLIEEMLVASGYCPGVIGTVNYRYHGPDGVRIICDAPLTTPDPLTLQGLLRTMADDGVTHVVMEVSSHALQQSRLGRTLFDVAVFTNLSRDHLDYHQTMERYFAAKQQMFMQHLKETGVAVIVSIPPEEGADDWGEMLVRALPAEQVVRCGLQLADEVTAKALDQSLDGFHCFLSLKGQQITFSSPLAGDYNVLNVLAAAGVGLGLGLQPEKIGKGLAAVGRIPGRLERITACGMPSAITPSVFVDYAHTPDALENVLKTLKNQATGRLVCVFGCGGDRDRGKRPLMGLIAGRYADVVLVTSDNPRTEDPQTIIDAIVGGVAASGKAVGQVQEMLTGPDPKQGFAIIGDRRTAIHTCCSLARPGDTILVAGKGHERYQIIGKDRHFFDDRLEVINGLAAWNLRHLIAATQGVLVSGVQKDVLLKVSTDSRQIGEGDIFVPLKGEHSDGHGFIDKAVQSGAAAVIAERIPEERPAQVGFIQVADTLEALGRLAGYRRRLFAGQVKVAAVTGSSGKTTVKEMIAGIFAQALKGVETGFDPVLKTGGNFNNLIGLPLSLLPLQAGHQLAILEMGMNAPGEIARLTAIADPDIGCINNIQPAHLLGLGNLEGVASAKGELFAGMRPEAIRVVNCDDPQVRRQAALSGGRQIGFAVTPAGRRYKPQVRVTRPENLGELGMRFTLHIGDWSHRLTVPMAGCHNVSNCAAASAVAHAAGIDSESIVRGLQEHMAVDKRLAVSVLPGGLQVVNDAYNANPSSMAAGLQTVAGFGADCRRMAALGDMLELGDAAAAAHKRTGRLVADLGYDYLAVAGMHAEDVAGAAKAAGMQPSHVRVFKEPQMMGEWVCQLLAAGSLGARDWLLVKGSRGMRMETLIDELELRLKTFAESCD